MKAMTDEELVQLIVDDAMKKIAQHIVRKQFQLLMEELKESQHRPAWQSMNQYWGKK